MTSRVVEIVPLEITDKELLSALASAAMSARPVWDCHALHVEPGFQWRAKAAITSPTRMMPTAETTVRRVAVAVGDSSAGRKMPATSQAIPAPLANQIGTSQGSVIRG